MTNKDESFNLRDFAKEFANAILQKIKGKDIRKKLDYLMKPDHLESSSILSKDQIDAVSSMIFVGETYPETLGDLKIFAKLYASWTPSKDGIRSEQLMQVLLQVTSEQPQNVTTINTGSGALKGGEKPEN